MQNPYVLQGRPDEQYTEYPVRRDRRKQYLVRYSAELSTGGLVLYSLVKVLPYKLGAPRHQGAAVDP